MVFEDNYFAREVIKEYDNGGVVEVYKMVDKNASDYDKIFASCDYFAKQGEKTVILPKAHHKEPLYKEAFRGIAGTKYDWKCPDFKVGENYYEHEGYTTNNAVNAFCNMISAGIKQSDRIVIDDCGISRRWAQRYLQTRVQNGDIIKEVWVLERDRRLTRLF